MENQATKIEMNRIIKELNSMDGYCFRQIELVKHVSSTFDQKLIGEHISKFKQDNAVTLSKIRQELNSIF